MHVAEPRDAGAFELLREVALRAVDDDQVRPQRQDLLDVGIEQRADVRKRAHLRRFTIETADRHHARPGPDREQHLRRCGNKGNDAGWQFLRLQRRCKQQKQQQ